MDIKINMPLVSVIIPCYNVEKYVMQCIKSVTNQTFSNLEIICINDGSTDNTLSVLQNTSQGDKRITIINQENSGVSAARNVGLSTITGDFVMFLDADDWLTTDSIATLLTCHDDEDIIIFSYFREFQTGRVPKNLLLDGVFDARFVQRMLIGPVNAEKKQIQSIDSLATVCCKIYRKEILKPNIIFKDLNEIGTWEDGFFNMETLNICNKVLIVNKPFYHYRKYNNTSITSTYKKDLQKKWIFKFKLLETYLNGQKKDKNFFLALNNRICITFLSLCLNEINSCASFFTINKKIKHLLKDDFYKNAFDKFELKFLPLHWKIFYYFVQYRFSLGISTMAFCIHLIINRKN